MDNVTKSLSRLKDGITNLISKFKEYLKPTIDSIKNLIVLHKFWDVIKEIITFFL
jgi:hypothetical protein